MTPLASVFNGVKMVWIHPKALTYPKVQKRIPAQPEATDQALAPPSGNGGCSGSSDLGSELVSCSMGFSEVLLCSLREWGLAEGSEDMTNLRGD